MAIIKTPLTDLFAPIIPCMSDKRCREFHLNYVECLEVYGYPKGGAKCKEQLEDFMECIYSRKQMERVAAMKKERWWQVMRGEKNWREIFAPIPPIDSYDEVYGPQN